MEGSTEKPWRRSAPNELVVNSILAATAAIVLQTIVTNKDVTYGAFWLFSAVASLLLFLISTEQIVESIRENDITRYIWSAISYNFGVLFLFVALYAMVLGYDQLSLIWSAVFYIPFFLISIWFWGLDAIFLINKKNPHYQLWLQKINGESLEEDPLDYREIIFGVIAEKFKRSRE